VGSFPVEAAVGGHVQPCPRSPASRSVLCRGQQLSQPGAAASDKTRLPHHTSYREDVPQQHLCLGLLVSGLNQVLEMSVSNLAPQNGASK